MLKNLMMVSPKSEPTHVEVVMEIPKDSILTINATEGIKIEIFDSIRDEPKALYIKLYENGSLTQIIDIPHGGE